MYLREVVSPRKHGPDVTYVQLCDSEWDPEQGHARTEILHSFGRKDALDLDQLRRLVDQMVAYLGPEDPPDLPAGVEITDTWDYGGTHLLDGLWRELELDTFFGTALAERSFETDVERALFALVAQRALCPGSKLAGARWAGARAWIPGLPEGGAELEVHHFYRAMDVLGEAMDELREHLYFQVTDLLNADVSVLFYDTTSVSFYLEEADPETRDDEDAPGGIRRYGTSKKKRPDLPQVVLALAVNRDGLPVRHWVFPGNTVDVTTVEEVTTDLLGLRPRRFLFIGDRGMVSAANLDFLESRRMPYLLGAKLRDRGVVDEQVLSIRGRYAEVDDTLGVKQTVVEDGSRPVRYLLCRDTERAEADRRVREAIVARLEELLNGSRTTETHTKKACELLAKPGYARFLRELKSGGLRIDLGAIAADERLDGKTVLMTNDLETPAGELATGYRDLWRAERAFRSMKSVLSIEPVYHRTTTRITAHAHLCVLAYLLIRVVENRTTTSWPLVREPLERISLARVETGGTAFHQRKRLTGPERTLWNKCHLDPPAKVLQVS